MLVFDSAPLDALRILKEAFVQVGWEGIDEFAHLLSLEAVNGPLARGIALALQFELASLLPLELVVLAARLENNFLVELLENLGSYVAASLPLSNSIKYFSPWRCLPDILVGETMNSKVDIFISNSFYLRIC